MIIGRLLNKLINIFTGLFGILTILFMLIIYINNAGGGFLPADTALRIGALRNYFTLATVFCAGIEFTLRRNLIAAMIFAGIIMAVAAFMLYTDFAM